MNYQYYFDNARKQYKINMTKYIKGIYSNILKNKKDNYLTAINTFIDINDELNKIQRNKY